METDIFYIRVRFRARRRKCTTDVVQRGRRDGGGILPIRERARDESSGMAPSTLRTAHGTGGIPRQFVQREAVQAIMSDDVVQRYQCVHRTFHGDGKANVLRIIGTCEEMLGDRGYEDVKRQAHPVAAIQRSDAVVVGKSASLPCPTVHVYICDENKVGVKYLRSVIEKSPNAKRIVVSLDGPTPFTRRESTDVQFMFAKDLCFNVTKHKLVPKHEVVDNHPIASNLLPKILDTDPVVQYYDWPKGTVVRVMRCYAGHEPIPYFRCVSASS